MIAGGGADVIVDWMGGALAARVLLQDPLGAVERGIDGSIRVLVLPAVSPLPANDEIATWDLQIDPHAIMLAVRLVSVRRLDRHVAGGQSGVELVQLLGMLPYVALDRFARGEVTHGDSERRLHRLAPVVRERARGRFGWAARRHVSCPRKGRSAAISR